MLRKHMLHSEQGMQAQLGSMSLSVCCACYACQRPVRGANRLLHNRAVPLHGVAPVRRLHEATRQHEVLPAIHDEMVPLQHSTRQARCEAAWACAHVDTHDIQPDIVRVLQSVLRRKRVHRAMDSSGPSPASKMPALALLSLPGHQLCKKLCRTNKACSSNELREQVCDNR